MLHPWLETRISGKTLTAEGWTQPLPVTARYRVRIRYRLGYWPVAEIIDPPLHRRVADQRVAHTNSVDNEPCLFTKERGDWRPSMFLATTVVPWLEEWLVFYEGWHLTGAWQGGGTLPAEYEVATAPIPSEVV